MNDVRYRMVALDADGTLVDHTEHVAEALNRALTALRIRGARLVLCTGRRFRRASEIARRAAFPGPLVCHSGAMVKDREARDAHWRADLELTTLEPLCELFQAENRPLLCFADDHDSEPDFHVDYCGQGHALFDDYVQQNADHAGVRPALWSELLAGERPAFHLCAIGARDEMAAFGRRVIAALGARVRTFVQRSPRYTGWMCEIVRGDAGKWSGIERIAAEWGIRDEQIVAVGDDWNDLSMIAAAGLGVAMSHAPSEVRRAASVVLDSGRENALADFLESLHVGSPVGASK